MLESSSVFLRDSLSSLHQTMEKEGQSAGNNKSLNKVRGEKLKKQLQKLHWTLVKY